MSRLVISFSFSNVLNYLKCLALCKRRFILFARAPLARFCSNASHKGVAEKEDSHRARIGFDHNAYWDWENLLHPVQVGFVCDSSRSKLFSIWFAWSFQKPELHQLCLTSSHCLSNNVDLLQYAIFAICLLLNVVLQFLVLGLTWLRVGTCVLGWNCGF